MTELWSTWWLTAVLLVVWIFLQRGVTWLFTLVQAALDRALPDRLERSTGEWLHELLEQWGIDSRIGVMEGKGDGYLAEPRIITLEPRTYHKRDPFFRAIGAHELGHALLHTRVVWLAWLLYLARYLFESVARVGQVVILGNVLYGSAAINTFALHLVELGLVLGLLVLLDELLASLIGVFVLRRHGRLRPRELAGAIAGLFAAFCTYAASVIGHLVFYLYFDGVARRIEEGIAFVPGTAPGTVATVVLVLLTLALGFRALLVIGVGLGGTPGGTAHRDVFETSNIAWCLFVTIFFVLTWDQATSQTGQFFACLAVLQVWTLAVTVAVLVMALLAAVVIALGRMLLPRAMREIDEDPPPPRESLLRGEESDDLRERIEAGAEVDELVAVRLSAAADAVQGSLVHRLRRILPALAYLPFVVWYWLR